MLRPSANVEEPAETADGGHSLTLNQTGVSSSSGRSGGAGSANSKKTACKKDSRKSLPRAEEGKRKRPDVGKSKIAGKGRENVKKPEKTKDKKKKDESSEQYETAQNLTLPSIILKLCAV